jgi:hypothetical protein
MNNTDDFVANRTVAESLRACFQQGGASPEACAKEALAITEANAPAMCREQTSRESCMATFPRESLLFMQELAEPRKTHESDKVYGQRLETLDRHIATLDVKQSCMWSGRGTAAGRNGNVGNCSYNPLHF